MKIKPEDRAAALAELKEKQSAKKSMPKEVAALLARGRCKDCDLPWAAIGVGAHVPVGDGWLCGACYRYQKTGISLVLGESATAGKVDAAFRGRCANKACGAGRDQRGSRVRAKVLKRGDFCSKVCQIALKDAMKQNQRSKGAGIA